MQVYGLSKAAAGGALSMSAFALIIGSPLVSHFSNRVGRKPAFIGCSLILVAVCLFFSLLPGRLPLGMLYVLFFFLSFSGGAISPVTATLTKELFPVSRAGTSVGTVNLFPFLGGAIFQLVIGSILSRGANMGVGYSLEAYRHMFLLCLCVALASLMAALLLTETHPRKTPP